MLNWQLIKHPTNWFIILLMVMLAAFAVEIGSQVFTDNAAA